ncbi:phage baseplate protein [Aurantimonas coralicida]|uniref:phage baseplate protein n=1 Tax=Aurantimonas coralicida TaxID=182270 RepID=UPI001E45C28D|nr:hypothetical protein [Aurantimonas coralicida]MCD1645243.1 hypothetical protein [Aurantimonas coralicida]
MTAIFFNRLIGPVPIDVVVSEKHENELEITLNPVEKSADMTDHAYRQPRRLMIDVASSSAALTYQALKRFQETRLPFSIVTGLDLYRNMLIRRLEADRDERFSQVLRCKVDLIEVILVGTAQVAGRQAGLNPENAGDQTTSDRVSGTVKRGDVGPSSSSPAAGAAAASGLQGYTAPSGSMLKQILGP